VTVNTPAKVVEYMRSGFEATPMAESFWAIRLDRKNHAFGLVGACGNTARRPRHVISRVHTASPPCAVKRWSVKPIRIDFIQSWVHKFNRTVRFAVRSIASVVLLFTPSTTPNSAPLDDYLSSA
jgi:hypothetical protein